MCTKGDKRMNKAEIQQRVLKNGHPLSQTLFDWDEQKSTLTTSESGLKFNFEGVDNIEFITRDRACFITGSSCTFRTGSCCTFITEDDCIFITGDFCVFTVGNRADITGGHSCTLKTGNFCYYVRNDLSCRTKVIEVPANVSIAISGVGIPGYVLL